MASTVLFEGFASPPLERNQKRGRGLRLGLVAGVLGSLSVLALSGPAVAADPRATHGKAPKTAASKAEKATDKPATDKSAADKSAADKPGAEKAVADKASADKAAGDKAVTDKALADKPADKALADKAAADKPADKALLDKAPNSAAPAAVPVAPSVGVGAAAPELARPQPTPQDVEEARRRFDRGIEMYADGDFALALIEFNRAHQLVANYRVLYNIGQVNLQLARYADARRALEAYVKQGGSELPADRAVSVQKDLAMLETRTAFLSVTTNIVGAEILLDEITVGTSPLSEPLLVDAGVHRISARRSGYLPKAEQVTLAGADESTVAISLEIMPTASKTIVMTGPEERIPTLVIVGWSATGVLAAGAIVTGIIGSSDVKKLKDLRSQETTQDELDEARSNARTMLLASDAMSAGALIVGGISLWATINALNEPEKSHSTAASNSGLDWNLDFGMREVRVTGSF